ncbi:MAG: Alkaline ceramidase domain protein, partial [Phycisphaerales bacterium]|nr:Alkaline ceramidase domain protein [Phycisphaerales bacterium]
LFRSTSGDVNNINVLGPRAAAPPATGPASRPTTRPVPYAQMRAVADQLAEAVLAAHATAAYHNRVPLKIAARELTLKSRRPSPELVGRAKRIVAGELKPKVPNELAYARRTLALADGPEEITIPLQAVSVGDLGITAIPFEVFAETGLDLKARSPFPATFTIELANGSYGYLPTPEQHKLGGYEAWLGTNRVEEDASVKITDAVLGLLGELRAER